MSTLSPSSLSATTCDLCHNGPVAVVLMPGLAVCENCIRASIAASEPKKEPMTEQRLQICSTCGGRVNLSGVCVRCDEEKSIQQPDPADVLRDALADYARFESRRNAVALGGVCHEHLPALLAELAQLRELAQAAVEWQRTLRLAFDEIGPGNVTLSAIARERREILDALISAYATSQPKASQ